MTRVRVAACGGALLALMGAALVVPQPANASPVPMPASVGFPDEHGDEDRVTGLDDACPSSPDGTRPLAHGCSAVEMVRRPEILTTETLVALDAMVAQLRDARPLTDARKHLERARTRIASAAVQVGQGRVCAAAATYDGASVELRAARHSMDWGVDALAARLIDFDARAEDASDGDVTVGFLRMLGARLGDVVLTGLAAGADIDTLCAADAGPFTERAKVTDVDDAAGLITLDTGRLVALTSARAPLQHPDRIHEGMPVTVIGTAFQDGTGAAERIQSHQRAVVKPAQACMALRIAPVQPFKPYTSDSYTLHRTQAYANPAMVLQLERGMRLAAQELDCPHATTTGLTLRYSMQIELIHGLLVSDVLAYDLEEGEEPVGLPPSAGSTGKIKTTVIVTACKQLANGEDLCEAPAIQHVRYYEERLRPRGHYSTAVYSQTTFGVKDNKVADDYDSASVVAMDLTDVPLGTNAHFVAEGYAISNGVSSRPQVVEVEQGEPFAIYDEDDFIPDDLILAQLDIVGVDREAGLVWPRVEGSRNGNTFWYSSRLPRVVRDLVSVCPDDPDTWYRLPFYGGWPTWVVNTGNDGDPIHGHGSSQPYAWDFNAAENTDIAAARGGTVVWVVEDEHLNAKDYPKDPNNPAKVDPSYTKIGNYIWILHSDGTLATYNHLTQGGALVSEGDVVHRGDHIGEVGNTGYSSQAHLHFEGGLVTVDWGVENPSVVKLPSRFEAKLGSPLPGTPFFTFTELDCFVPKAQDKVLSTQ